MHGGRYPRSISNWVNFISRWNNTPFDVALRRTFSLHSCAISVDPAADHDQNRYYTGQKKAPLLTIVIGGNHEASNYLWELWVPFPIATPTTSYMYIVRYHGGWLAPNIYFLGYTGCVQVNGIRIAGASGIFKGHDLSEVWDHLPLLLISQGVFSGHSEKMPYDNSSIRSIYHIREYNIRRLSLVRTSSSFS